MGSNMQKQATPCLVPEAPFVATGIEAQGRHRYRPRRCCRGRRRDHPRRCQEDRLQRQEDRQEATNTIWSSSQRTNGFTAFHQRPIVSVGDKVKKGDILADTSTSDHGEIALGHNALVAFMSWSGSNYEDAIILSERVVKNSKWSSIHIEEFVVNVRDTKLGPEVTTRDIPNVGEAKLKNLDRGRHRPHRRRSPPRRHPGRQDLAERRDPAHSGRTPLAFDLRRESARC